jgi:hypothetical protein
MTLSPYHQNYLSRSDEELARRADVKEMELVKIFAASPFALVLDPVRVAVLGCADHRMVSAHKRIFEKVLGKKVKLTTFDVTTEHLAGEEGVLQHDLTTPFPDALYDIAFGHVVLKFIETERQWDVLKNSYDAIGSGGMVIHVFDLEEVEATTERISQGCYAVPLERWKKSLDDAGINYQDVRWDIDLGSIPIGIRGLRGGALILRKP